MLAHPLLPLYNPLFDIPYVFVLLIKYVNCTDTVSDLMPYPTVLQVADRIYSKASACVDDGHKLFDTLLQDHNIV